MANTVETMLAGLPPEYQAEIAKLLRQRALGDTFTQQGLSALNQPTQFTPGPYSYAVPQNPLGSLAHGLAAYLGNRGATQADTGIAGIGQKAAEATAQGISQIAGAGPEIRSTMINQGLASTNPQIRAFSLQQQKQDQDTATAAAKGLFDYGDPRAALATLRARQINPNYSPTPIPGPQFSSIPGPNGMPINYAVTTNRKGEQNVHTLGGQQINVSTAGELAATKALGGQVPEVAAKARQDALDAQQGIENSRQILTLAKDPQIIAGFASNLQLGLSSLATKLGFMGPDGVAKTQALLAAQARQTLAASTLLKGAISDKEKPFLEQASSGSLAFTPEAIQHLAALSFAVNHNKLLAAKDQWQGAVSVPGAQAAPQMYPFPPIQYEVPQGLKFTELPQGRLRYDQGLLAPSTTVTPPPKPVNEMTPEEKQAEIDAIKKKLGIGQ